MAQMHPIRTAEVRGQASVVDRYLPQNYYIVDAADGIVRVQGRDVAGWTLDGYVLPRLASALIFGEEVDVVVDSGRG